MNKREGTASGRHIIPIFANKKKKLRQALYANPSQEMPSRRETSSYSKYTDEFSKEFDDTHEFAAIDEALFEGNDNSNSKENNFHASNTNNFSSYRPSYSPQPSTSTNNANWSHGRASRGKGVASQSPNPSSTGRGQEYQISGTARAGSYGSVGRAPSLIKYPNKQGGNNQNRYSGTEGILQVCMASHYTSEDLDHDHIFPKVHHRSAMTLLEALHLYSGPHSSSQFTFAKVSSQNGLPVPISPAKGSLPPGHAIQPIAAVTHRSASKMQKESKASLIQNTTTTTGKKNSKQVNLLKTPADNSMKLITASVTGMKHWNQYRDQTAILFEIFGTLDSALSSNNNGTAKNFVIKDETGTLRCTFWEMDRTLPRLIRGQVQRCVGTMDRRIETFNCISVRPTTPAERRLVRKYIEISDQAMQEHLSVLKEL